MFSSIGQIFKVQPRQAENSDTRQHIQRHDPDFERKKNKKQEEKEELFPEEGAVVSVEALRIFLENFLKSLTEETNTAQTASQPHETDKAQAEFAWDEPAQSPSSRPARPKPISGEAAHAVGAYQSMARVQQRTSLLEGDAAIAGAPPIKLEASEVRTIHQILEDLKDVEAKKIEYIRIERGETFLKSIAVAVEKIKHGPGYQI